MDADTEKTAKPRRRWLRFSLRTLLIVVTVLSVPLGWIGWKRGQGRSVRATITWVEEMEGEVSFLSRVVGSDEMWWEVSTGRLFGERVGSVFLSNTQVSDLSPLAELKNLERLWLHNTQVSNLSPLAGVKNLEELWLKNTQVSDEQVQKLKQALPNCEIYHSTRNDK